MYPVGILAGGLATRLHPITTFMPKSLIPINNRPFIDWQLEHLARSGITRVVLLVGHLGNLIESYVGDGSRYGLLVEYSYDGDTQMGTGGAVIKALPLLGDCFAITYGDSYLPMNFSSAEGKFRESGKLGLMSIYRNQNPAHRNNVKYEQGKIIRYSKGSAYIDMNHIDYGFNLFKADAFGPYSENAPLGLAQVSEDLSIKGELEGFEVEKTFFEIGSFEGIAALVEELKGKTE